MPLFTCCKNSLKTIFGWVHTYLAYKEGTPPSLCPLTIVIPIYHAATKLCVSLKNLVLKNLVLFNRQLEEMIRCPDCYLMSNLRTKNWFCKPCVSVVLQSLLLA